MSYDLELSVAESILRDKFGVDMTLQFEGVVDGHSQGKMVLFRCALDNASAGVPETVIVKRWYESLERFRRECGCLDFLSRQDRTRDLFPELFGWDKEQGIFVVEDLGDEEGQSLGHILFDDDPERAEYALFGFMRAMGFMHADTMGRVDEFRRVLNLYNAEQDPYDRTDNLEKKIRIFARDVGDWGFDGVAGLDQDVNQILSYMDNPGPFLSFVHGDTTLSNAYLTEQGIRLFDLESGGMRHCLTDGAFSRMRYLESSLAHQFPIGIRRRMMQVYREALATGCPSALDEDLFIPSFVACCACWMAKQCDRMKLYFEQNEPWGRVGERARVVTGLENFAQLSAETRWFSALGETASGLAQVLKQKWPEDDYRLPVYPAFV